MQQQLEYELFLKQVNKLIDRRQAITATYLTVNTAVVGAIALFYKDVQMLDWGRQLSALVLLIAGIASCGLWRRLISQYSALLGWWYTRLRELEIAVPGCSALINREYTELYQQKAGKQPFGMTRYEIGLTWLFTTAYLLFGGVILGLLILR
jgi:hypothetical protein